jgi:hypothetical protein
MLLLSRRDFLPSADDAARQRMHIAVTLFGEVPRAVFTGDDAPRHSQRRVTPSPAELRLLKEVSLSVEAQSEPAVEAVAGQLL